MLLFAKPPTLEPTDLSTKSANFDPTNFRSRSGSEPILPATQDVSIWKPKTDKPYMCPVCSKGFSHVFTLLRHRNTVCGKIRNTTGEWKCRHCNRTYETKGNLTRHCKFECGVSRQFYCIFCNRKFTQRCSVKRHIENFHKKDVSEVEGSITTNDPTTPPIFYSAPVSSTSDHEREKTSYHHVSDSHSLSPVPSLQQ